MEGKIPGCMKPLSRLLDAVPCLVYRYFAGKSHYCGGRPGHGRSQITIATVKYLWWEALWHEAPFFALVVHARVLGSKKDRSVSLVWFNCMKKPALSVHIYQFIVLVLFEISSLQTLPNTPNLIPILPTQRPRGWLIWQIT